MSASGGLAYTCLQKLPVCAAPNLGIEKSQQFWLRVRGPPLCTFLSEAVARASLYCCSEAELQARLGEARIACVLRA